MGGSPSNITGVEVGAPPIRSQGGAKMNTRTIAIIALIIAVIVLIILLT
jgi:hypothetical protein